MSRPERDWLPALLCCTVTLYHPIFSHHQPHLEAAYSTTQHFFSRKRRAQLQAALAKRYEAKKTIIPLPNFEKFPPKPDVGPIHPFEYPDDCVDDILQYVHWEGLSDTH